MKLLFTFLALFGLQVHAQIYNIQVQLTKGDSVPELLREMPVYTQSAKYPNFKKIVQSDAVVKKALTKVKDPNKNRVALAEVKKNLSAVLSDTGTSYLRFKTPYKEFGLQFLDALTTLALEEEQIARYRFYEDSLMFYDNKKDQAAVLVVENIRNKWDFNKHVLSCLYEYAEDQKWKMMKASMINGAEIPEREKLLQAEIEIEYASETEGLILPQIEVVELEGQKRIVKVKIALKSAESTYISSEEKKTHFQIQNMKIAPQYLYSRAEVVE